MSTTRNTDAVANQAPGGGSGEFQPRIKRDEPMMTGGHQPGKLVGNDAVSDFQAKTLPPGSAPAENTFKPNPVSEVPPSSGSGSKQTQASNTIPGATSGDVHAGLGKPMQGQTSNELRHDGEHGRKNPGQSMEGVGAKVEDFKTANPHDPDMKHLRALDKDEAQVGRGNVGGLPAQEREPETAGNI